MPPRSKRDPAETELAALDAAVETSEDMEAALRAGLESGFAMVVARAAVLTRSLEVRNLDGALAASYERLAEDATELDPVCAAMKEIVATLFEFESDTASVYLHAARHVQHAGWDGQDVGAPLRGVGVQALVLVEHPEALSIATDMLTDAEAMARIGAAKALRAAGSESSALVLRLKAQAGDTSPEVYENCFGAMLEYSGEWLDAVAPFLSSNEDGLVELAALAIGEVRPPGALACLKEAWGMQTNPDAREAILNAIASLRDDDGVEFLIDLVGGESVTAMQALSALTLYAASEGVVARVQRSAYANRRSEVGAMFERLFA